MSAVGIYLINLMLRINVHSHPKGHYEPSPAQGRFYDMCADHIVENNDGIDEDELFKAVAYMKFENEEEHERNIKNMIPDDDYKSPWGKKLLHYDLLTRAR